MMNGGCSSRFGKFQVKRTFIAIKLLSWSDGQTTSMAVDRQQRSAAVAYRAGTKHGPSFDLKDKSIDEVWLVTCAELFFPLGQDLLGFSEELEEICLWMTDVSNLSKDFRCYLKYDGVMQVELKDSRNSKDPIKEIQTALSSLKWVMTIVPKSEGGLSLMNSSPFVQAVMVYMKDHSPITPEELNYHAELKAASQWSCSDDYEQLVSKKVPDSDCRLKTAVKTTLVTWGKMVNDLQKCDSSNNQLSDYRLAIGVLKNYLEEGKPTCSDKKDVEGILERGTSPGKPPENSPGKNLLVPKGIPLEESQQSPKVFALKGAMAPALHANFMEEHPSAAGTKLLQNGSPRKRKQKANGDENVPVKKVKAAQRRVSPRRKKKPSL